MKPKQCLETLKIRKMISFPSFTPAEGLCHLPSFNLNSEERDREVLRAVFSFWATVLPGNLDSRPFSGDSCICPLGSKGWKYTLPPEPPRRAPFPGLQFSFGISRYSVSGWEQPCPSGSWLNSFTCGPWVSSCVTSQQGTMVVTDEVLGSYVTANTTEYIYTILCF